MMRIMALRGIVVITEELRLIIRDLNINKNQRVFKLISSVRDKKLNLIKALFNGWKSLIALFKITSGQIMRKYMSMILNRLYGVHGCFKWPKEYISLIRISMIITLKLKFNREYQQKLYDTPSCLKILRLKIPSRAYEAINTYI